MTLLEKSLQGLTEEAEKLFKVLDNASAKIRGFENTFQALKVNFPFEWTIKEDAESKSSFCWERDFGKKFRLFLKTEKVFGDKWDITLKRPFIECNIENRITYIAYINTFYEEFEKYIHTKRLELINAQAKIMEEDEIPYADN